MTIPLDALNRVVQKIEPQASVLAAWTLRGGISARMTALEVALSQGLRRKWIVRQPGQRALQHNPLAAQQEFHILQRVQAAGVKTPSPYLLDESGEILPQPYLVIEYIEGAPDYALLDVHDFVAQMAAQLAMLHRVEGATPDLALLPRQAARLAAMIQQRPARLDDSLYEEPIRAALAALWPPPMLGSERLLHGDFWPGNLLWREGKLVAVIDWEDAEVGNPLADVAISRLDLLWIFGREAMNTFTHHYQTLMGADRAIDFGQLPFWDLMAALRPASRIEEWAADWAALGRSDITAETMRAGLEWFVARAFARL
jgi:aminoglycoside phosphotransferase (APT) family kinase protein